MPLERVLVRRSAAAAVAPSAPGARAPRGATAARRARRRASARRRCGRPGATARRRRTASRRARSTRANSANERSSSGRWCSTAWPSTRSNALVLERQLGGVAGGGLDARGRAARVGLERREHARRDVGAGAPLDDTRLHQVEREVAGARADLERARERPGLRAEQLVSLPSTCWLADRAERDPPLGVVARRPPRRGSGG